MTNYLIPGKVFYKIFDKNYKYSSLLYAKHKVQNILELQNIDKNLTAIKKDLKTDNILILNQVHGNNVMDVDNICNFNLEPKGDGALTTKNKVALCIQTADCAPVLLASICGKIIGAAHCGWRSAKANIIGNIVRKMKEKGALELKAIIGPCIKQNSYETDETFYNEFIKDDKSNNRFFIKKTYNQYMFDLTSYVVNKLNESNVKDITISEEDTYLMPNKYPSYRYAMHNNYLEQSRILSTIIIC